MNTFEIKYFDGKTSAIQYGTVKLAYGHWDIRLNHPDGTMSSIHWQLKDIKQTEFVGNTNIFKYGDFPQQTLECTDSDFVKALQKEYPNYEFFKKEYVWALNKGLEVFIGITVVLLALCFGIYKYILPTVAEGLALTVPQEYEIKWGDMMFENMIQAPQKEDLSESLNLTKNDTLSKLANQFAKEMDFKTTYPIKITVVDEKVVNAFALPGGNIVVFNGLLQKMKNKEEFAALLGHEVAHVTHKHSLKNIFRSLSGYLFISLITNDLNGVTAVILENANQLQNLGYSRELEAEADASSMKTLKTNQIATKGLYNLFKILEDGNHGEIPEILSSHPLTDERKKFAKKNQILNEKPIEKARLESVWGEIIAYNSKNKK
ncbi:MAG: M48 family metallopeptidase [Arcicella sp.]|jgi:Zn-dependent protease with chaperone function|nr:M48 family metallopeptidase [Arcicella sp.]